MKVNFRVPGLITRTQSGFFTVKTEEGTLVCQLRGRLKQGAREGDIAAIGDRVQVTRTDANTGLIEEIEPRERMISRMAPTPRGEYRQIIIANPDQILYVFACADPEPRMRMLDRFLVTAEEQDVPPLIVANKVDLIGIEEARQLFNRYEKVGYPVLYTSAKSGYGINHLDEQLSDKISALAGPSGAGKSSLLNALQPGLGLEVKEVSQATGKGTHTTVVSVMFPLKGGSYVADTPGLKALALWDIEPEELDGYFPEIRRRVADCQFSDCTHVHEPGCAVKEAVKQGEIHPERYESYVRMRLEEQENE
ncbi:MAG TPA: ribosome small subunit-dependent GTPase A [Anaerolineales bacterium]